MMPVKSDIGRENSPDQGDHPEELPFSQPPREAGSLVLVVIFSAGWRGVDLAKRGVDLAKRRSGVHATQTFEVPPTCRGRKQRLARRKVSKRWQHGGRGRRGGGVEEYGRLGYTF